jgi:quinol monooxygenase YgiN
MLHSVAYVAIFGNGYSTWNSADLIRARRHFNGRCEDHMDARQPYIRIAELEIDPAQLESFNAAIKESIETAVRIEPGVLTLYAVSETDNPARVRVFEIYTDADAYKTHLKTPAFQEISGNDGEHGQVPGTHRRCPYCAERKGEVRRAGGVSAKHVIARSDSDEAIHSSFVGLWIASLRSQ